MTALEALREKKHFKFALTAIEQVILDLYYQYREVDTDEARTQVALAETAANELAHMNERIKEHLPS